ncbi:DUF397 domain-containing protein [Streptomyces sp. NPDC001523]|uniref:DUF397 domain-containing protein n=1 Tax=Streptomyces sp. NPDC001523 TaxID=3154383 RepID=UPI00332826AD
MERSVDLSNAIWRTSTYTNGDNGDCVEVADNVPGIIPVRDTKARRRPPVLVAASAWVPFVRALKAGELSG